MAAPLAGRNAIVLGVEHPAARRAAVALAEAGADVAVATLTTDTAAEFAANSTANEFWAVGRKGIVLTTDGGEPTIREAIAEAAVQLGPLSIVVCHAPQPLARAALAGLRSDPAIIVIIPREAADVDAAALAAWVRELADAGLRANAVVVARSLLPGLSEHRAESATDVASAVLHLASDATAAIDAAQIAVPE
ncbi:MAG: hypothetical protein HYX50_04380 [Chloroflexi bacterium]|nr:hypothetical protein [Chloroflexota bacterium]